MHNPILTFIGAGNMASSLIGGLIADGYNPAAIWATDPSLEKLTVLRERFKIQVTQDNNEAAAKADILILAVKPQAMKIVVKQLALTVTKKQPLIISIAAMIPTGHIEKWLSSKHPIVRCMPNTPALLRCGASGLYANSVVKEEQRNLAESILRTVGLTVWINNEEQMDIVTALSGSGPAYFFLLMEILQKAAEKMGLDAKTARLLVLETGLGAARLALESEQDLSALRHQVTSPGGTTERALEILEQGKLSELFYNALRAAEQRAKEMAQHLDQD